MSDRLPRAYLSFGTGNHEPIQVAAFELLRQPYAVDAARIISINYSKKLLKEMEPSSPVVLSWGKGTKMQRLYGYLYSVRPVVDKTNRTTEAIITGFHSPMAVFRRTRTFRKMGPHNVAAEILDYYRFRMHTKPSTEVRDYQQEDINDWQFLCDVARASGYVLLSRESDIQFVPIEWLWSRQVQQQRRAATFRNALSPGSNLASFNRDRAQFRPATAGKESPFGTAGDFTRQTDRFWEGQKSGDVFRGMFPQTAQAKMLGPVDVYPFDVYDVRTDIERSTWTVLQVVYRLTTEEYYASVTFGGDGRKYYSRVLPDEFDIAKAMDYQEMTPTKPRLLNHLPVFSGSYPSYAAHWESRAVHPPGTEAAAWLR